MERAAVAFGDARPVGPRRAGPIWPSLRILHHGGQSVAGAGRSTTARLPLTSRLSSVQSSTLAAAQPTYHRRLGHPPATNLRIVRETSPTRCSERDVMFMIKKVFGLGVALALFGFVLAPSARADEWSRATKITFSQPVDVAGHVLLAGTYLFKIADANDRHIVQIFSADGKTIIATVMTIPDYRLKATNETVIKFREVPAGSPEAVRAWFYPGRTNGEEFVYPKRRAIELARAAKVVVPAIAVDTIDVADVAALKTAPIVAVTPEEKVVPVTVAI